MQVDPIAQDFRNFLFVCWQHLGLPEPTAIQYDIAFYLQHGPRRKVIEAFRGVGKSWITAAYVLWLLYKNHEERILVVSASSDRAKAFTIFTRRLIEEMPLLQHLKPRKDQRDSAIAFDIGPAKAHQAPSVRSVGITGQMTGGRATRIVADDVEVPKNSLTQSMRDKLGNAVKEFDAVLSPKGTVDYLGTPQTEMSLYNVLPSRGYAVRIWSARYPSAAINQGTYAGKLAPIIQKALEENPELPNECHGRGAPVEPTRFDDKDLIERETSYARSGFQMQFMLSTTLSDQDRYPLKLADLVVMPMTGNLAPVAVSWSSGPEEIINDIESVGLEGDRLHRPIFISKEFKKYQGTILSIDPAGRGTDELAFSVISMLNGWLYLRACTGLQGGYTDANLQKLADVAKFFSATEVYIEDTWGDGMFSKLLAPFLTRTYPCTIEGMKSNKQKELRIIETLEPVMQQHKLVVSQELLKGDQENYNGYSEDKSHQYQLFYQMSRITKDRGSLVKDDRIDAVAMGVFRWKEQMDRDTNKAEQAHKDFMQQQALKEFATQVFGHKPKAKSWM